MRGFLMFGLGAGYSVAMSEANLEIVRRGVDAFNRRDLEPLLESIHPDAEWVEDPRYPGAETFHGRSGVEQSMRKWWDAWGDITMALDEVIDMEDRVVVAGRVRARGQDSDVAVEAPFGGVYEFRDDKVIRVRILGSREEALAAAGPPA